MWSIYGHCNAGSTYRWKCIFPPLDFDPLPTFFGYRCRNKCLSFQLIPKGHYFILVGGRTWHEKHLFHLWPTQLWLRGKWHRIYEPRQGSPQPVELHFLPRSAERKAGEWTLEYGIIRGPLCKQVQSWSYWSSLSLASWTLLFLP